MYPKKEISLVYVVFPIIDGLALIKTHSRIWGVHLQISFPRSAGFYHRSQGQQNNNGIEPIDGSQDDRHRGRDKVTISIRDCIDGLQWTVNSKQGRDTINGCEAICLKIQQWRYSLDCKWGKPEHQYINNHYYIGFTPYRTIIQTSKSLNTVLPIGITPVKSSDNLNKSIGSASSHHSSSLSEKKGEPMGLTWTNDRIKRRNN